MNYIDSLQEKNADNESVSMSNQEETTASPASDNAQSSEGEIFLGSKNGLEFYYRGIDPNGNDYYVSFPFFVLC